MKEGAKGGQELQHKPTKQAMFSPIDCTHILTITRGHCQSLAIFLGVCSSTKSSVCCPTDAVEQASSKTSKHCLTNSVLIRFSLAAVYLDQVENWLQYVLCFRLGGSFLLEAKASTHTCLMAMSDFSIRLATLNVYMAATKQGSSILSKREKREQEYNNKNR